MPPSAMHLILLFKAIKLNLDISKNFLDLLTLKIGDKKISLQFCFCFIIISLEL